MLLCSAIGDRDGLQAVPDGLGGVLLTWFDHRPSTAPYEIYAARILPDGSLARGWAANGTVVSDITGPGNEFDPAIASDGAGGAYVVWRREDYTGDPNFVQHLTATGGVAPGWPPFGIRLSQTSSQFDPRAIEDGQGGAIVVWHEGSISRQGIYAQRYTPSGPTPVLLSLVTAEVKADVVDLHWYAAARAGLRATVYRRTQHTNWLSLAGVSATGTGHLRYEDRTVSPGERYAYRLGYLEAGVEQFGAETWVVVPALALALEGFRPNPAAGSPVVAFTLPDASPARLELFDVAGRQVLAREVGSLAAGRQQVSLADAGISPGLYVIRLSRVGRTLSARGVVTR